ncbi:MAG TPA: efflux RND transporter periplasmic adaptor subunit, partial [Chromatiales bacterium]|nr:efflux RND transporter periplasmic adaptor subunit [Chromatiales bacterium]
FRTGKVTTRDIVVAVEAAGVIEPFLTVEVKSKASGEILDIFGETGDVVEQGAQLARIDQRVPRNQLAQAESKLEAAKARLNIAEAQAKRSKSLLKSRTINDVDYETTVLELANAKADVVASRVAVENARIALEDANVKAPITGTIIEKLVEKGQVISSPTMDVGGGTLLFKMADLSSVQVKALVDETDIGKIQPEQPVTVTVTAFPNQPFAGKVLKVEPQAEEEQTVTTFSVLIVLDNESGLLRPGMNADVEIKVAEAKNVVAVPTAALRTVRDIPVAAQLVGLTADEVREQLGMAASGGARKGPGGSGGAAAAAPRRPGGRQASGGGSRRGRSGGYRFANRYWVFVQKDDGSIQAVNVETGLTDLDYSEVRKGLKDGDTVILLPSSGLVQAQQRLQSRMRQFTSLPGMNSNKKKSTDRGGR